nr:NifX-associated nitrogen fixation protein [uncultured Rhodopila sp.]
MSATLEDPMTSPFLLCLVSRIRAEDQFGAWDRKTDKDLLKDYLMTKAERRLVPIIGDPDPETLDRVEKFYQAVGLTVERLTGIIATPMMKMSHEGFGRVVLIAGSLVVLAKTLRDVHRFGFEDLAALAAEGMKAAQAAVAMIEAHPELARA